MTAMEQLRVLRRQFPRASELAVSHELLEQYESELVQAARPVGSVVAVPAEEPPAVIRGRVIQRTSLRYRGATLAILV